MEALCAVACFAGVILLFASYPYWKGKNGWFGKSSSGTGSAMALQQIVEPKVQHVIHVTDRKRRDAENGLAQGEGEST